MKITVGRDVINRKLYFHPQQKKNVRKNETLRLQNTSCTKIKWVFFKIFNLISRV